MIDNINKIFASIIFLSLLTFLAKADYNLPLFAFAIILWNHKKPPQKIRVWYLILFSIFVDCIWLLYWGISWQSYVFKNTAFYTFTIIISIVIFLLKMFLCVVLTMRDATCREAIVDLPKNMVGIFQGGEIEEEEY